MNIKNLDFLKDGLKYMGFGDKLNADLEKQITAQPKEFQLTMEGEYKKEGGTDRIDYRLDFKKSDQTDMYFFNRYQATLRNDDPAKEKTQTFYVTKGAGLTAKEAYNLLNGRSVNKDLTNKEGQPYNAWLQLNFTEKDKNDNFKVKQYHSGYGYDLAAALTKYPIKELANEEEKTKIQKSLEKGNIQQVTFLKEGREDKMFVEANPQYKNLNLYDAKMAKQFQGIEKKESAPEKSQEKDKSQDKKETQKQEVDEEGEGKKAKSKRKGVGV